MKLEREKLKEEKLEKEKAIEEIERNRDLAVRVEEGEGGGGHEGGERKRPTRLDCKHTWLKGK